jgi:hypothetical protein
MATNINSLENPVDARVRKDIYMRPVDLDCLAEAHANYAELIGKEVTDASITYLDSLPLETAKVSSRSVKKALGLSDLAARTWTRVFDHVSEYSGTWRKQSQSFVRVTFDDLG